MNAIRRWLLNRREEQARWRVRLALMELADAKAAYTVAKLNHDEALQAVLTFNEGRSLEGEA